MEATTSPTILAHKILLQKNSKKRFRTVGAFQEWLDSQDVNYEYVNRKVLKKEQMKYEELMIVWWLRKFFKQTETYKQEADLILEVGILLPNEHFRFPDLSYFTAQQHVAAAKGQKPIPALAIEILSKSETAQHIQDKIKDYFDSGVKVVWYIYPQNETVYVYTSTKEIKVCEGDDVVSAKPAIDDFEFPASAIFNKEQD